MASRDDACRGKTYPMIELKTSLERDQGVERVMDALIHAHHYEEPVIFPREDPQSTHQIAGGMMDAGCRIGLSESMETLATLTARFPRAGRVDWIGLRPERRAPVEVVAEAALTEAGLAGDRSRAGKRALTLIQAEHLPVIAALAGREVGPELLRRNLVVSGINLGALRGRRLAIGAAVIEITTPCAPCSRMEEALGPGGYNAMRGHGGWCATVVTPARIAVAAEVQPDG